MIYKENNASIYQSWSPCSYDFCDIHLNDDETLKATIRMFDELQLMTTFHISYEVQPGKK